MPRSFGFDLKAEHRYEVEFFLPKRGAQQQITNARYVVSRQQEHLIGFHGLRRVSLGVGTLLLNVRVLHPVHSPVAS